MALAMVPALGMAILRTRQSKEASPDGESKPMPAMRK
jgi:hypothetical protein